MGRGTRGPEGYPTIEMGGAPFVGNPLRFRVVGGPPSGSAYLMVGTRVEARFAAHLGAVLYPGGLLKTLRFPLAADGTSSWQLAQGSVPDALCGEELVLQAFVVARERPALVASAGVRVRFGHRSEEWPFAVRRFQAAGPLGGAVDGVADLALADVDVDGHLDLVTAGGVPAFTGQTHVVPGTGDGGFGPPASLGVAGVDLELADLDDNGLVDVASATGFEELLRIELNSGPAGFAHGQELPLAIQAKTLTLGDWNVDGAIDVALADWSGNQLRIALNAGDATFSLLPTFAGLQFPRALTADDYDADGFPDLVVGDVDRALVHLGTGDGGFGVPTVFTFLGEVLQLHSTDQDRDGLPDVVVGERLDDPLSAISVLRGRTTGALFQRRLVIGTSSPLDWFAMGHLDQDALLDVVLCSEPEVGPGELAWGLGDATGNRFPTRVGQSWQHADTSSPALGDLDGDGALDLVYANNLDDTATVVRGTGTGLLLASEGVPLSTTSVFAAQDVNGDGIPDLARANLIRISRPDGSWDSSPITLQNQRRAMTWGDVDGDGRGDLVAVGGFDGASAVNVVLAPAFGGPLVSPAGSSAHRVAAGDVNGDGRLDMALAVTLAAYSIHLGAGDGTFVQGDAPAGPRAEDVALVDLDGDGRLDLVVAESGGSSVHLGDGAGHFTQAALLGDVTTRCVASGDLDGDGHVDLVLGGNEVLAQRGNGDGTFGPPWVLVSAATTTKAERVHLADLDRDLVLDVVAEQDTGSFAVALGRGDGTFEPFELYDAGAGGEFVLTDWNRDLLPDVLVEGSRVMPNRLMGPP